MVKALRIQNPLGSWPNFGKQPRYEAPGDPQIEISQNAVINM